MFFILAIAFFLCKWYLAAAAMLLLALANMGRP